MRTFTVTDEQFSVLDTFITKAIKSGCYGDLKTVDSLKEISVALKEFEAEDKAIDEIIDTKGIRNLYDAIQECLYNSADVVSELIPEGMHLEALLVLEKDEA